MQKPVRGFQDRANVPEFEENFEKIDAFRTHKYRQFGEKSIDISSALTDEEVEIEANGIFIKYPVDVDIRVNEINAPKINALQFRYIGGYIHKIFLTSTPQTPQLEILTGVNAEMGFLNDTYLLEDEKSGAVDASLVARYKWHCLPYASKRITIKNTDAVDALKYEIQGILGSHSTTIKKDTTGIAAGEHIDILVTEMFNKIYVWLEGAAADTSYEIKVVGSTGFSAPNVGAQEDTAHVSGDYGVMSLSVRKNAAAALAGADGDYIPLISNAAGKLWVVDSDVGSHLSHLKHAEDGAHSSSDYGNMALGVRRDTPASTTTADGDYSPLTVTDEGRLHTEPNDIGTGVGAEDTTVGGTTGSFGAQAFKKGCMIVVNDMGTTNTWIEIRIGSGKVRCTAAGQGIDWIPIANASEITVIGDGADNGKVSYTGV